MEGHDLNSDSDSDHLEFLDNSYIDEEIDEEIVDIGLNDEDERENSCDYFRVYTCPCYDKKYPRIIELLSMFQIYRYYYYDTNVYNNYPN